VLKTLKEAIKTIENDYKLVILDLNLPDGKGLENLSKIFEISTSIPILIITGLNDSDIAFEAIKMGAQDYVLKENLNPDMLERVITYAIEREKHVSEIRGKNNEINQEL
jgi:DNA-binding NtrC family response regulator